MEQMYAKVSVLITGGAGFIGSHLADRLVALGAHVTILDDLSTGSLINIEHLQDKIHFIHGNITDFATCQQAAYGKKIIFHLAAFLSVPKSLETPRLCHDSNIAGTFNMLEAARLNNVERFVFSSSAAVYGPVSGQCHEDMQCAPISPYGYSKLIGELYCQQYAKNFNLGTVCLRYFNVYGHRQNPAGSYAAVVAKFTHQMQHNLPITLFGDGSQTRDFVPVQTIVDANLTLAQLPQDMMKGDSYNIASGNSISLLALIELLKKEYPAYTAPIIFEPGRAGDLQHSQASVEKFTRILSSSSPSFKDQTLSL